LESYSMLKPGIVLASAYISWKSISNDTLPTLALDYCKSYIFYIPLEFHRTN
jgi:hypothetical protein